MVWFPLRCSQANGSQSSFNTICASAFCHNPPPRFRSSPFLGRLRKGAFAVPSEDYSHVPPLLHGLFTVQGDRPNTNSQARVLRKKNTMKNQNSRLLSRSEQSVVNRQSDFIRHCANRRLSTDKVLNYLRTRLPQQYGLTEVVGKWVWLDVSPARKPGLASLLWALGFHWNQRRGVWQHPCGSFNPFGIHPADPRAKYRSYFPADLQNA